MEGLRFSDIYRALEVMELPVFISLKELKSRYRELARKYHPDMSNGDKMMGEINESYKVLKTYMENYRFTFSQDEVLKQFPQDEHALRFRF